MPAGRKSSVGSIVRKPIAKGHVPFRADDFQHGKRTGVAVRIVDHKSDEFEAFETVIGQADAYTLVKVKGDGRKKQKKQEPEPDDDDDEYGEMSMELVESDPASPAAYFTNSRQPPPPPSIRRVSSSSRAVTRNSEAGIDSVPSPRPVATHARRQTTTKANGVNGSGSSRLSRALSSPELDRRQEYDDTAIDIGYDDEIPSYDDEIPSYDYSIPLPSEGTDDSDNEPFVPSPPRASFTQMNQDDDIDEELHAASEINPPSPDLFPLTTGTSTTMSTSTTIKRTRADSVESQNRASAKRPRYSEDEAEDEEESAPNRASIKKGKSRAVLEDRRENIQDLDYDYDQDQDPGVEEEIAKNLRAVENEERENGSAMENEPPRPAKKRAPRKPRKGVPRMLREIMRGIPVDVDERGRGKRSRITPLDWWRNEAPVYQRGEVAQYRKLPKEPVEPLGAKKKRRKPNSSRGKSKTVEPELVVNPEEGWDDNTDPTGTVLDYATKQEVSRRLALTAKMVQPRPGANNDFYFQKVFGDGDFMAAGQIIIPPGSSKPSKPSKDNTYVFYVIEGAVKYQCHDSTFILTTGGMFLVPRGNMYYIENISDRDAKLFFAQARKIPVAEEEPPPVILAPRAVPSMLSIAGDTNGNSRASTAPAPRDGGNDRRSSTAEGGQQGKPPSKATQSKRAGSVKA